MTYNVYRDGAKIKDGSTVTTFSDTGLTPNKSYSYQVSSVNELGEGPLSEPLVVKTLYSTPTGVTLNNTTLALATGGNSTLVATTAPTTAAQLITWTSSTPANATVDANGKVVAVKAGSASIAAASTADPTKKATCVVTVTDPVVAVTGVTVAPTTASLVVGGTQQLTPTIAPANATNKTVTYTTSDATLATVSAAGLITAVVAGTVTITATSAADATKKATCVVTITAP